MPIAPQGSNRRGAKQKGPHCCEPFDYLAERVGFEPTVPCGTPDFESGTIDHSATSPDSVPLVN